jgi:hypothetical protein
MMMTMMKKKKKTIMGSFIFVVAFKGGGKRLRVRIDRQ